ncbi:MAG: ribonuclease [Betaproteobacteria bacterium]|nr:ribonuclease [Betaproteobacteria bacterium]
MNQAARAPERVATAWRRLLALLLGLALLGLALIGLSGAARAYSSEVRLADLPAEARQTLALIKAGGPFPYARDGAVFGNFEQRLPRQKRGYYREYTVPTPGLKHRGPRRIVAGRSSDYYFTSDHYQSFRRIRE